MKKVLIIGSLLAAMVIAGCSDKSDVAVDKGATSSNTTDNNNANTNDNGTISNGSSENEYSTANPASLDSIYFAFDKYVIQGDKNINAIKNNAKAIIDSGSKVRVEGNTDEWGTDEYNYALGLKRASSAKDALINNNVPADKIDLVSYGESKPKCTQKTKECWQENRRVDFVIESSATK